ncbi:MAG: LPS assembly lipoprotein LptE [Burkholderiales bacterium]
MPFSSIYVVTTDYSSFAAELKRYLASGKKGNVVERAEDAEVTLEILREASEKQVLSLSTAGRVREFELRYRVLYRLSDRSKREWISPTELLLRRDLTFDDRELLAKENEEALLLRDMKNDAMRQILRRLSKANPPSAT